MLKNAWECSGIQANILSRFGSKTDAKTQDESRARFFLTRLQHSDCVA